MSEDREPSPSSGAKAGPQGTQAFSREQLAEVLEESTSRDLPAANRASLVRVDAERPSGGEPARYELHSDRMTIGRAAACELRIEEPSISSEHARLVRSDEGWRVVNLLSTNGVFVNGQKVFSHLLSDGDEIRLGRARLRFVDPNSGGKKTSAGAGRWLALAAVAVLAAVALVWLLR